MPGENLKLDLDPKKVIESMRAIGQNAEQLADIVEEALGKNAVKSVASLEQAAEKGTSKIAAYFTNLGQRVKNDLKTAFDVSSVLAGAKMGKEITEGVKQVFDLERAFDRLNVRLGMSSKNLQDFKNNLRTKVAATGQSIENVMPGVEQAASRGGIKDAGQLASIGEALGKARAATGEDTGNLSEQIIEIMKNQGQKMNAGNFSSTLNALQGTRVNGAFGSAGEAGAAVGALSPYAQQFHLNTRELGGLSATASQGGQAGNSILQQLLAKGSTPGGMTALNSILGQDVFKNGKLNASAIGKIDTGRFGQYSAQTLEGATGLQGASGADLKRFVEAFKNNMGSFDAVVRGANETSNQFEAASDNLATKVDRFKEQLKNAGGQVGEGLSGAANELLKGNLKGAFSKLGDAGDSAMSNRHVLEAGVATTAIGGLLLGGGINSLFKKIPGAGLLAGAATGEAAKAAGIQPVYVTNASEISGGGAAGGLMGASGIMGKIGKGAGVLGVGLASYDAGKALGDTKLGDAIAQPIASAIAAIFTTGDLNQAKYEAARSAAKLQDKTNQANGMPAMTKEEFAKAVSDGFIDGHSKTNDKKPLTTPSKVTRTGASL